MKLIDLHIENLKGIKQFVIHPDGHNLTIAGKNGTGKTTVYDAFLWLFYGKDSAGRTDSGKGAFDIHPLDCNNNPIPGLETTVEAEIEIDTSTPVKLKKVLKEKIVKGERTGWETYCWIDDVPKKVGEYKEEIAELFNEDIFKLVTDLHYFNDKLHWKERRKMLMRLWSGEVELPEFAEFVADMKGKKEEEYQKMITEQRKKLKEQRDEINPRIDEQQKTLDDYAGDIDTSSIENQRKEIQNELKALDAKRRSVLESDSKRAKQLDALNDLKSKKSDRETALRNDTTGAKPIYEQKEKLSGKVSEKQNAVSDIERKIISVRAELNNRKSGLAESQEELDNVRKRYLAMKDLDFSQSTCNACGQILPADKIDALKSDNEAKMKQLASRGQTLKEQKGNHQKLVEESQSKLNELEESLEKAKIEYQEAKVYVDQELIKIDQVLEHRTKLTPDKDPVWRQIVSDIQQLEDMMPAPISEQLADLDMDIESKRNELTEFDRQLSSTDSRQKAAKRIKELKKQEKELSIQIAELDGKLDTLGKYIQAKANVVEQEINSKFKYVDFKLFNILLNGSIEPCCESMLNGTPYSSCSYGEKALMGADIINVLSEIENISAPIFIDNSESLTFDLDLSCQTIFLCADQDADELIVSGPTDPAGQPVGKPQTESDELF
jgi:exonuclease SbcC